MNSFFPTLSNIMQVVPSFFDPTRKVSDPCYLSIESPYIRRMYVDFSLMSDRWDEPQSLPHYLFVQLNHEQLWHDFFKVPLIRSLPSDVVGLILGYIRKEDLPWAFFDHLYQDDVPHRLVNQWGGVVYPEPDFFAEVEELVIHGLEVLTVWVHQPLYGSRERLTRLSQQNAKQETPGIPPEKETCRLLRPTMAR